MSGPTESGGSRWTRSPSGAVWRLLHTRTRFPDRLIDVIPGWTHAVVLHGITSITRADVRARAARQALMRK
jgi:hypothetical protein